MTVEGSSSDARTLRAPAMALRHGVCFEESGDCTLERIAREARKGDAVLVFGPTAWDETLREFGLATGVAVDRRARVAGVWRFDERRAEQSHNVSTIAYGLQAWRIAGGAAVRAPLPSEVPNAPRWPDGRRARRMSARCSSAASDPKRSTSRLWRARWEWRLSVGRRFGSWCRQQRRVGKRLMRFSAAQRNASERSLILAQSDRGSFFRRSMPAFLIAMARLSAAW